MIKGCFFKIIALVIIIIGVAYYVYQEFGIEDLLIKEKERVTKQITEDIKDHLFNIDNIPLRDSVKQVLDKYIDDAGNYSDKIAGNKKEEIIKLIEKIRKDNFAGQDKLSELKELLKKNEN